MSVCVVFLNDIYADCPEDIDELWSIRWPFTPAGHTVTVSCGVDFIGM